MTDVFISYSRVDSDFVRGLFRILEKQGHDAWVDWEDIAYAEDWWQKICAGIEAAHNFVFVISPDSVRSDVCYREVQHAVDTNKRIIPVLYRDVSKADQATMHPAIARHNWLPFRVTDQVEAPLNKLLETIKRDPHHAKAHTRLLVRALEWQNNDHNRSFLLNGDDLREAESWLAAGLGKDPAPTEYHAQYINASRIAERRRQRNLLTGVVTALAVTIVLGILAFIQFQNSQRNLDARDQRATGEANQALTAEYNLQVADRNAAVQTSQRLVANARQLLTQGENELALALALEANQIADPPAEAQLMLAEAAYSPGSVQILKAHTKAVSALAFTPNGQYLLSGGSDSLEALGESVSPSDSVETSILVWDLSSGEIVQLLEGHRDNINQLSVSPNGDRVVSASNDGTAILWDLTTGDSLYRLELGEAVNTAIFSPDGQMVLTGSASLGVVFWDSATGQKVREITDLYGFPLFTEKIAFHPDGQLLAVLGMTGISLWDAATGDLLALLSEDVEALHGVAGIAFSPDGRLLLTSTIEGDPLLFDVQQRQLLRTFIGSTGGLSGLNFSPDGSMVVSAVGGLFSGINADWSLVLWNVSTGTEIRRFKGEAGNFGYWAVAFSPDGRYIASGDSRGEIRLWDLQSGAIQRQLRSDDISAMEAVAFTPDSHYILSGGSGLPPDILPQVIDAAESNTSPQALELTVGSGTLTLWETATGIPIRQWDAHLQTVHRVAISPDGQQAASGGYDGIVMLWELFTGTLRAEFKEHNTVITTLEWSPDGTMILSGAADNQVLLWDPRNGQVLQHLPHNNSISSGTFSPDAELIVTGSGAQEQTLRVWEVQTGELLHEINLTVTVTAIAFNPEGSRLLVGTDEGTLLLWDTATWTALGQAMTGHDGNGFLRVSSIDFSPDGQLAMSASWDGTLIIWDMRTQTAIRRLRGHTNIVNGAAFSPDGRTIASASSDASLILWRVDTYSALVNWVLQNRFVPTLSCPQRSQYGVPGSCTEVAAAATRTPFPTLTASPSLPPSPTLNVEQISPTPTNTLTVTPSATFTFTPLPGNTATPTFEPLPALPFEELAARAAALEMGFTPLLPTAMLPGFQLYRVRRFEAGEPGNMREDQAEASFIFAVTDGLYSPETAEQIFVMKQTTSPYPDLDAFLDAEYGPLISLMGSKTSVNGVEVFVILPENLGLSQDEAGTLVYAIYKGLLISFTARHMNDNLEAFIAQVFFAEQVPVQHTR